MLRVVWLGLLLVNSRSATHREERVDVPRGTVPPDVHCVLAQGHVVERRVDGSLAAVPAHPVVEVVALRLVVVTVARQAQATEGRGHEARCNGIRYTLGCGLMEA